MAFTHALKDLGSSVYTHHELIAVLVAKQLKLRYRGSILGFFWTLLNPVVLMLVYTLVFSVYLRVDMERYPAFLFSGLVPWIWFSSSLQQGVTCIVEGAPLVTRSRFPAEVLPLVTLTANTINFLLTLPLLVAFLLLFDVRLGLPVLALPVLVGLEFLLAAGPVLMLAALNVRFRDLQHIIIHLLTVLLFLTPIFYPLALVPEPFRAWAFVNPLTSLISAYQDVLYFNRFPDSLRLLEVVLVSLAALFAAVAIFMRQKSSFAESL